MVDLLDYVRENSMERESPLAPRLRPRTLDKVVGQQHIVDRDGPLYQAIQADKLGSAIFCGFPGAGKTTLVKVIANTTSADSKQINVTMVDRKDMEEVAKEAKDNMGMCDRKAILFVDETHRFNERQQDYLLPFVGDGTLVLIGAATENPYLEINSALISRSGVFESKPLEKDDIKELIHRAVYDRDKGMGSYDAVIDEDAVDFLANTTNGDTRAASNAVELRVLIAGRGEDQKIHIDLTVAQEYIQKRVARYDKNRDNHCDTISASIKNMWSSGPDTTVYYLARMLYMEGDIKFIAGRIMICASEDVSNASPQTLVVAVSAAMTVEYIGMPGAQIVPPQAVAYVASAPKSNAVYNATFKAMEIIKSQKTTSVPVHLQDKHYKGVEKLGHGAGYKYAHDHPKHYVRQQYLPDGLEGGVFCESSDSGYEKQIGQYMKWLKE